MTLRLTALAALAFVSTLAQAELVAENAWVRAGPPSASVLAGYLTLRNTGAEAETVTGAASGQFLRVEMHRTEIDDKGMARMFQIEQQKLPPGATLEFKPGGDHLMLIKPKKPLKVGDHVIVTLTLSGSKTTDVHAVVRSAEDVPATGGHGGH